MDTEANTIILHAHLKASVIPIFKPMFDWTQTNTLCCGAWCEFKVEDGVVCEWYLMHACVCLCGIHRRPFNDSRSDDASECGSFFTRMNH